jgi:hypothetical protein
MRFKPKERKKVAEKALAAFADSTTLARAQDSVASVTEKWEAKVAGGIKRASDAHEAAVYAKVWDRFGALQAPARMAWLEKHAADPVIASALLTVPSVLCGLTDPELAMVRKKIEAAVLPREVVEAKVAVRKAMREVETGWERATAKIAARGGLEKASTGIQSVAGRHPRRHAIRRFRFGSAK